MTEKGEGLLLLDAEQDDEDGSAHISHSALVQLTAVDFA